MFGGGNTWYLMHWLNKSGLSDILPELLKTKVYVGISAGSIVTANEFSLLHIYYPDEDDHGQQNGLGFVDFEIRPHLNSPWFPKVAVEHLLDLTKNIKSSIYAIDDQSAIKVDGDKVEIVSEGSWKKFN